jgi:hypothetical protein
MTTSKALGFLIILVALASWPAVIACSTGGERARLGCPAGETCSSMIDGLHFSGAAPSVHSLFAIAVGGTERVRVQRDPGLRGTPYAGAFDARSSDPSILAIDSVDGSDVTLAAVAAGHAYLRIVEPGTEILLDRVDIQVSAVSAQTVTTFAASISGASTTDVAAVWSDASVRLILGLRDPSGVFLWDDSLSVAGHPTTLVEIPAGLRIDAVAPVSGTLVLTTTRDAGTDHITLPVVVDATGIELSGDALHVEVGGTASICAVGHASGGLIAGAPVTATLPAIVEDAPAAVPTVDGIPLEGCVGVHGLAVGTGTATIALGGQTADVAVTVVAASSPLTGPSIDLADVHGRSTAGERASAW